MPSESIEAFQTPKLPAISPGHETPPSWVGLAGPPPLSPLRWKWTCHKCHQTYPLGATRRCLSDGHYFCSGRGSNATTGLQRPRRHRASTPSCTSEFDYIGWTAYNAWRRKEFRARDRIAQAVPREAGSTDNKNNNETAMRRGRARARPSRSCDRCCDYPSECQWEAENLVERARSESEVLDEAWHEHEATPRPAATSFEEIIDLGMTDVDSGLEEEQLHTLTRDVPPQPQREDQSSKDASTGRLQVGLRAILSRERMRWAPRRKSY